MDKFIHLPLLLAAAVQLPLVSGTRLHLQEGSRVTFKFPSLWTVKCCCKDDRCICPDKQESPGSSLPNVMMNNTALTIVNLDQEHNGNYRCDGAVQSPTHTDVPLYFNITGCNIGGISCAVEEENKITKNACERLCHQYSKCSESFENSKCFLYLQRKDVVIELNKHTVSGQPLQNSNSEINGLQFYPDATSWIDALEHCNHMESSLVQITNQTVQAAVNYLLQNKTNSMQRGVWIGLERSIFGTKVPWKWISGSEAERHLPWNASFPVDVLNYHCGKIIWVEELQQFKWLDASCREKLPYICQYPDKDREVIWKQQEFIHYSTFGELH